MKWRGRRQSGNVEDRRGGGPGGFGGMRGGRIRMRLPGGRATGGGIGGLGFIIAIIVISMALGIDPSALLNGTLTTGGYKQPSSTASADDEMRQFVGVVVADTESFWTRMFAESGETYSAPKVVLFSGRSPSGCGLADAATGPFYCPADRKVYIDLSFYDQLKRQFGAGGDFAEAYVLAHEIGHHVQNLTGVLPAFNRARQTMSAAEINAYSVRVELQADCYAGVWAAYESSQGLLDPDDIQEALTAASKIGDDTLQKRAQGFAVPDSFTHGTSAQRVKWFRAGHGSGDPGICDTFSVDSL